MTVTECNIYGIPACRGLAVLPHDKDVSDKMHQMVKALSSQAVTGGSCNDIRLDTAATCVKHETGSCPGCEAQHSIRCSLLCGNAVTVQDCEVLTERQLAGFLHGQKACLSLGQAISWATDCKLSLVTAAQLQSCGRSHARLCLGGSQLFVIGE